MQPQVNVRGKGESWHAHLSGGAYKLHRTASIDGSRILIKDTIETNGEGWHELEGGAVGLQVNHSVQLATGEPVAASIPGELYAFSCSNANIEDTTKYSLMRGGFGNPSVHAETTTGGVGVVPLDDVTESHAVATQAVVGRYPRMPASMSPCPVTQPPSVLLADPYLALPPATNHTMEWAIYPLNRSCSSYWCVVQSEC